MLKATPRHTTGTQCHPGVSGTATRWLAVALAMVVLGGLSTRESRLHSQDTERFHMPLGAGAATGTTRTEAFAAGAASRVSGPQGSLTSD